MDDDKKGISMYSVLTKIVQDKKGIMSCVYIKKKSSCHAHAHAHVCIIVYIFWIICHLYQVYFTGFANY